MKKKFVKSMSFKDTSLNVWPISTQNLKSDRIFREDHNI